MERGEMMDKNVEHGVDRENPEHVPASDRCRGRGRSGFGHGACVEPAALAALLLDDSYGYDLKKTISSLTDGLVDVDSGGLYRVLRRFEDEGVAVSEWAEGDGGGPARRSYRITEKGRLLAEEWLEHLRQRERMASTIANLVEKGLERSSL